MKVGTVKNKGRTAEIMLVDDNYGDVILAKKAFTEGRLANRITVACDGVQALSMLRREPGYEDAPVPDIILLDLNLPKKSGGEVLAEIKHDPKLKHIPVVILTSSSAEADVAKSYHLHANSYIVKPASLDQFSQVVKTIEQFWFSIAVLQNEEPA